MATETAATEPTSVYLEVGKKRVFACAIDWPGWCRSGKNEQLALEALAEYVPRYAEVAKQAGIDFPTSAGDLLQVVEQLPGTASTDFGAPGEATASDANPLSGAEAERITALVRASWAVFDRIAAETPEQLRKGPRGGGRDRDKMIGHVLGAEASYARKLGIKHQQPAIGDTDTIAALRDEIAAVLAAPSDGTPLVPKGWLPRYAARRVAWHVLDHAWEMQDRTEPAD